MRAWGQMPGRFVSAGRRTGLWLIWWVLGGLWVCGSLLLLRIIATCFFPRIFLTYMPPNLTDFAQLSSVIVLERTDTRPFDLLFSVLCAVEHVARRTLGFHFGQ